MTPTKIASGSVMTGTERRLAALAAFGECQGVSLCQGFDLYIFIRRAPRLPNFSPSLDGSLRWQPSASSITARCSGLKCLHAVLLEGSARRPVARDEMGGVHV